MSLSMAYATKKKQKMAQGGEMTHQCIGKGCEHMSHGGEAMPMDKKERAMAAFHGKPMAEGGSSDDETHRYHNEKGVNKAPYWQPEKGKSYAGTAQRAGNTATSDEERSFQHGEAKDSHKETLAEMRSMKKPNLMAEGGQITDNEQSPDKPEVDGDLMDGAHLDAEMSNDLPASVNDDNALDMIGRIMSKHMMSKGGMIANEDQGESASAPSGMAKDDPNEFDDLALRDDLDSGYTGGNSGDELGDGREDSDEADIISRVMRSRSKRDRMAVSGEGSTYGKGK